MDLVACVCLAIREDEWSPRVSYSYSMLTPSHSRMNDHRESHSPVTTNIREMNGHRESHSPLPSQVKISKVTFQNIKGTSRTQSTVSLLCSKGSPCEGVEVGDIDITYSGTEGPAKSSCENITPSLKGKQNPQVCTAAASPVAAPAAASSS
ncbi:polygalacturonase-like [Lycium ferocissimum]|uniref:polygalacturonase-like n=1 Tax=Lycium ferocissimum TaxID=112874 RepID=UPI002814BD10|nr:polygalacturonase-like [Lycium ferocissimum]